VIECKSWTNFATNFAVNLTVAGSLLEEIDFYISAEGHGRGLREKGRGGVKIAVGFTPYWWESRCRRESRWQNPGGNQDAGRNHDGKTPVGFTPYWWEP
jgi:hypothetical protein